MALPLKLPPVQDEGGHHGVEALVVITMVEDPQRTVTELRARLEATDDKQELPSCAQRSA